jgi:hypothetical protein
MLKTTEPAMTTTYRAAHSSSAALLIKSGAVFVIGPTYQGTLVH